MSMIFINYKTYESGTGQNALNLSRIFDEVAHESQIKIIPVVQATDVKEIVSSTKLEVWVQNIDSVELGAHTGSIVPEAVFEDGAVGTFLNHSENRFTSFDELAKASDRAKEVGLKTLIFAADIKEFKDITSLSPTFLAFEPPELVGSAEVSVTSKPETVTEASEIAKQAGIPLVVGAGIHSQADIKKCLELGAVGVVVASDIMKAEDPRGELLDLIEGFK